MGAQRVRQIEREIDRDREIERWREGISRGRAII